MHKLCTDFWLETCVISHQAILCLIYFAGDELRLWHFVNLMIKQFSMWCVWINAKITTEINGWWNRTAHIESDQQSKYMHSALANPNVNVSWRARLCIFGWCCVLSLPLSISLCACHIVSQWMFSNACSPIEIYIITHLVDSITISSCCCRCHV